MSLNGHPSIFQLIAPVGAYLHKWSSLAHNKLSIAGISDLVAVCIHFTVVNDHESL